MEKYMTFKQGDRVEFDFQTLKGQGIIVGMASTPMPEIGSLWIIQPDAGILPIEKYPYTHFICPEVRIKKIV